MSALFRRVVNVTIAPGDGLAIESALGVEVSNLDCTFHVKKNLKQEPNTCELRMFNLAESTRKILEIPKKLVLRLEAGYPNTVAQIYLGEVRSAHTHREGPNGVTEVSAGDSEKAIQTARINLSVGPKVPADVVLTAIVRELKIGPGNAKRVPAMLQAKGIVAMYGTKGTVISGGAARALNDFCRSGDFEWSIQDGELVILDRGKALDDKAVLLSPETGLIGSPTIDHEGLVSAMALIQPDLRPGRKVDFDTESFHGGYRVQQCEYTGDTAGTEWYVKFSAKKY